MHYSLKHIIIVVYVSLLVSLQWILHNWLHASSSVTLVLIITGVIGIAGLVFNLQTLYINEHTLRGVAEQSLSQLKEIAEVRQRFVGGIGHDIRQPLSVIRITVAVLRDMVGDKADPAFERAERAITRVNNMVNDLSDYARTGSGAELPIHPTYTTFVEIIKSTIDDFSLLDPSRHWKTTLVGNATGYWDIMRVQQLITNFLCNAMSYAEPHTDIYVECICGSNVILRVSNTGKKISPGLKDKLFEPYIRGRNTNASGLGLGLYICKQVIIAHGGTLEVIEKELTEDLSMITFQAILPLDRRKLRLI